MAQAIVGATVHAALRDGRAWSPTCAADASTLDGGGGPPSGIGYTHLLQLCKGLVVQGRDERAAMAAVRCWGCSRDGPAGWQGN